MLHMFEIISFHLSPENKMKNDTHGEIYNLWQNQYN